MANTNDQIVADYQKSLGRAPENQQVIQQWMKDPNAAADIAKSSEAQTYATSQGADNPALIQQVMNRTGTTGAVPSGFGAAGSYTAPTQGTSAPGAYTPPTQGTSAPGVASFPVQGSAAPGSYTAPTQGSSAPGVVTQPGQGTSAPGIATTGLLKGGSGPIMMQNIRTLMAQGIPEAQAIQQAMAYSKGNPSGNAGSGIGGSAKGALTGF